MLLSREVLQADVHSVEAICIRALCLYQADNLDKCIQFLKQGLTFAPDNSRCLGLYRVRLMFIIHFRFEMFQIKIVILYRKSSKSKISENLLHLYTNLENMLRLNQYMRSVVKPLKATT